MFKPLKSIVHINKISVNTLKFPNLIFTDIPKVTFTLN